MSRQNESDILIDDTRDISERWRYAVIIVMIVCFSIPGFNWSEYILGRSRYYV